MNKTDEMRYAMIATDHVNRKFYEQEISRWDVTGNIQSAMMDKPIIAVYYQNLFLAACTVEQILSSEQEKVRTSLDIAMINASINHEEEINQYLQEIVMECMNRNSMAALEGYQTEEQAISYQKVI